MYAQENIQEDIIKETIFKDKAPPQDKQEIKQIYNQQNKDALIPTHTGSPNLSHSTNTFSMPVSSNDNRSVHIFNVQYTKSVFVFQINRHMNTYYISWSYKQCFMYKLASKNLYFSKFFRILLFSPHSVSYI